MALAAKHLSFVRQTSPGVQHVTGVGFEGRALVLWSTLQVSDGATTDALMSCGLADGLKQSVRFIRLPHGETATTSCQVERTNRIAWQAAATSGSTPTRDVEGEFVGFTADGFDINWSATDGIAARYHALVLGGTVQASLQQIKIPSGGTLDVTGVGFRPQGFIVLGGAADYDGTGDINLGAPFGSMHGLGFSDATSNVGGWTLGRGTGVAADNYRGQTTTQVASIRTANLGGAGVLAEARITAISADGFTLTCDTAAQLPIQHILCLRGVRVAIGSATAPLTPGNVTLPLSFNPDLLLLQTLGAPASTNTGGLGLALGAWDRASGASGGTWIGGVDAALPSVYRRSSYDDLVLETRTASSGAVALQAAVSATDAGSATVTFSQVSGLADAILYMALVSEALVGSFVAGVHTSVIASQAAAFGLDGATHIHSTSGQFKVYGTTSLTSTLDVGGAAASHALATFNGQYTSPLVSHVSPGATLTVDFAAGNEHYISLNVDCVVTFRNAADGGRYIVYVVSNGHAITWDSRVRWAGGTAPTLTTGGKLDLTTHGYVPSVDRFIGAFNLNYDLS